MQVRSLVPEGADDRLGEAHLPRERFGILRRLGAGSEHGHVARAIGQRAQPGVDAGRRHVMQLDRDDPRRQPLAPPAEPFDEAAATLVVEQQAGVAAAARGIRRKQGADAQAEVRHARVGIGQRPGGTHRGARTATHAQMRLDPDMVTVGRDRRGRADVDAQVATLLPRATVRADRCLVVEEFRLLELADRQRDFRHRGRLRRRIGTGSPIALGRLVHAKNGLSAEIQHEVEVFGPRAVAPVEIDRLHGAAGDDALAVVAAAVEVDLVAPVDGVLGTGLDAGVAACAHVEIDRVLLRPTCLERAQPAAQRIEPAAVDWVVALRRQFGARGAPRDEHRDRELAMQPLRPRQRQPGRAGDQELSFRLERDARNRVRLGQRSGRDQRRNLWRGGTRFDRPARRFAHVDEADRLRLPALLRDVTEQARLLRTGDDDIAGGAGDKRREFLLTQLSMQRQRPGDFQRARERVRVERHRAVAVAQLQRTVAQAHWASTLAAALGNAAAALPPKGAQFASWGCPAPLMLSSLRSRSAAFGASSATGGTASVGAGSMAVGCRFRRGRLRHGRQRRAERRRHDLPRSPWSSAD